MMLPTYANTMNEEYLRRPHIRPMGREGNSALQRTCDEEGAGAAIGAARYSMLQSAVGDAVLPPLTNGQGMGYHVG